MPKIKSIALILSVLIMSFLTGYLVLAWTEPSQTPPTCPAGEPGCDAPLNVGSTDQSKIGSLTFPAFYDFDDNTYYVDPSAPVSAIFSGRVGIGITGPVANLDVRNTIFVEGGSGDIYADGKIDIFDSLKYLRHLTGSTPLTETEYPIADMDGDGRVTWDDYGIMNELFLEDPTDIGLHRNAERAIHSVYGAISPDTFYVNGNVGIGITNPSQKLDVVGGYSRSDTGFCIGADCITSWPAGGAASNEVGGVSTSSSSSVELVSATITVPENGKILALFSSNITGAALNYNTVFVSFDGGTLGPIPWPSVCGTAIGGAINDRSANCSGSYVWTSVPAGTYTIKVMWQVGASGIFIGARFARLDLIVIP